MSQFEGSTSECADVPLVRWISVEKTSREHPSGTVNPANADNSPCSSGSVSNPSLATNNTRSFNMPFCFLASWFQHLPAFLYSRAFKTRFFTSLGKSLCFQPANFSNSTPRVNALHMVSTSNIDMFSRQFSILVIR